MIEREIEKTLLNKSLKISQLSRNATLAPQLAHKDLHSTMKLEFMKAENSEKGNTIKKINTALKKKNTDTKILD